MTNTRTRRLFDPEDRAVLSDDYHRTFFTDIRQTTSFVKVRLWLLMDQRRV